MLPDLRPSCDRPGAWLRVSIGGCDNAEGAIPWAVGTVRCNMLAVEASISNTGSGDCLDKNGPSPTESVAYYAHQCPGVGCVEGISRGSARDGSDVISKRKGQAKISLVRPGWRDLEQGLKDGIWHAVASVLEVAQVARMPSGNVIYLLLESGRS